jgi:hypothetical protein
MDLLQTHFTGLESHNETIWFPRGPWHTMRSNPNNLSEDMLKAPSELIKRNLQSSGIYLELFAGSADQAYELSKSSDWIVYTTDIVATKFNNYQHLINNGIYVYECGVESIIENDLPYKVDVIAAFDTFGQQSKTATSGGENDANNWYSLMEKVEQWIFRNSKYLLINGSQFLDKSYAQQKCIYSNNFINTHIIDTIFDMSLIKFK